MASPSAAPASGPATRRAGSPGTMRMVTKTTTRIPKSTGSRKRRRRPIRWTMEGEPDGAGAAGGGRARRAAPRSVLYDHVVLPHRAAERDHVHVLQLLLRGADELGRDEEEPGGVLHDLLLRDLVRLHPLCAVRGLAPGGQRVIDGVALVEGEVVGARRPVRGEEGATEAPVDVLRAVRPGEQSEVGGADGDGALD